MSAANIPGDEVDVPDPSPDPTQMGAGEGQGEGGVTPDGEGEPIPDQHSLTVTLNTPDGSEVASDSWSIEAASDEEAAVLAVETLGAEYGALAEQSMGGGGGGMEPGMEGAPMPPEPGMEPGMEGAPPGPGMDPGMGGGGAPPAM